MGDITDRITPEDLETLDKDELNARAVEVHKQIDSVGLDELTDEYVDSAWAGYQQHVASRDAERKAEYYGRLNLEIGLSLVRRKRDEDGLTAGEAVRWFIDDQGPAMFRRAVEVGYAKPNDEAAFLAGLEALGPLAEAISKELDGPVEPADAARVL